ncbi:hypothetical protein ABZP36_027289 [Zizania latifolia]
MLREDNRAIKMQMMGNICGDCRTKTDENAYLGAADQTTVRPYAITAMLETEAQRQVELMFPWTAAQISAEKRGAAVRNTRLA